MKLFSRNWGKWQDLSVGAYYETKCLLQARRHKDGRVQFRVEKSAGINSPAPTLEQLADVKFEQ